MASDSLRIVLVAGESSGDLLGAALINGLRAAFHNQIVFEGIAGPNMEAAGCRVLFPSEKLAVMGLFEVVGRLPELLRIRRSLAQRLREDPPSLFIGIDAPDFNLPLERKLKALGIPTLHYVSPSVWAWRKGRLKGIRQAVDHMLTLFPFETDVYREHGIPATCVGHPLVRELQSGWDQADARRELHITDPSPVVAILPGSRSGEYRRLTPVFLDSVQLLRERGYPVQGVIPAIDRKAHHWITELLGGYGDSLPVRVVEGQSRTVLRAADLALLASGTATLEALLLDRPMVVAYRFSWMTYQVLRRLVKIRLFSLPNLLAGEALVPEFVQRAANAENCAAALQTWMDRPDKRAALRERFGQLRAELGRCAGGQAVQVVAQILERHDGSV